MLFRHIHETEWCTGLGSKWQLVDVVSMFSSATVLISCSREVDLRTLTYGQIALETVTRASVWGKKSDLVSYKQFLRPHTIFKCQESPLFCILLQNGNICLYCRGLVNLNWHRYLIIFWLVLLNWNCIWVTELSLRSVFEWTE